MDDYEALAERLFAHGMTAPYGSMERTNQVQGAAAIRELVKKVGVTIPIGTLKTDKIPKDIRPGTIEVYEPEGSIFIRVADDESRAQAIARHFGCKTMPWQDAYYNGKKGPTSVG